MGYIWLYILARVAGTDIYRTIVPDRYMGHTIEEMELVCNNIGREELTL